MVPKSAGKNNVEQGCTGVGEAVLFNGVRKPLLGNMILLGKI